MTTATRVLSIARGELGTVGGRKYQNAHGVSSGAWCAYFATWVLRQAGITNGPWTGWTPAIVSWAKARGQWKTKNPRPGDLVLYMWPEVSSAGRGNPAVCHVGIVEYVVTGGIHAIEGNTSSTISGSQYNGNTVARRVRKSYIVGYVDMAPHYTGGGAGSTAATNKDGSLTIDQDGIRGPATIARWQEVMGTPIDGKISRPSTLIRADQEFLNRTLQAGNLRDLTGATKLAVDGYEGPRTIKARQFWLFNQHAPAVLGRSARPGDFDGIAGKTTTRLHQYALNRATARSGRY